MNSRPHSWALGLLLAMANLGCTATPKMTTTGTATPRPSIDRPETTGKGLFSPEPGKNFPLADAIVILRPGPPGETKDSLVMNWFSQKLTASQRDEFVDRFAQKGNDGFASSGARAWIYADATGDVDVACIRLYLSYRFDRRVSEPGLPIEQTSGRSRKKWPTRVDRQTLGWSPHFAQERAPL